MVTHKQLLLEQIDEKDIIDEEMGNDAFIAITNEAVYFVFKGAVAGSFFGKKVKTFPLEHITSVDIGKQFLASYIELTAAGMGGSAHTIANYFAFNENRVFFLNSQLKRFQELSEKIRKLMKKSKNSNSGTSDADEIEKLHSLMKKGIISEKEFESKKKKILGL
jgi:hypothetical protein